MTVSIKRSNFETEVTCSNTPVLLDFYADWCTPCKMMAPVIDEISDEAAGIKVGKVNIDEEPELASAFQILSIPALVMIKDGKVAQTMIGVQTKDRIMSILGSQ